VDELLGISDFSARCGLSVKMLRAYAARGLLAPAAVDASSGYRYYAAGQLHEARVVALLRRAGVPVREIATFAGRPEQEQLDRWARQIDREWTARRRALDEARAALAFEPATVSSISEARKGEAMTCTLVAGAASDIGGRATNEDALVVSDRLFAVADGLGGLAMGEVASRTALDTLAGSMGEAPTTARLRAAGREAGDAVWRCAEGRDAAIGTTLTALAITDDDGAVVLHVGDSRLYRLRHGRLEQLTEDHTVTADLVRTGALDERDAGSHPHRHVLTRALGVAPVTELDEAPVAVEAGDRLLLCTDGLYQAFEGSDPGALQDALAAGDEPQACAEELVSSAVRRGATDNATALVIVVR
jgi:serine/threonine protein phosphatase PrpC/DNA-binding transcriptional MerR regulator